MTVLRGVRLSLRPWRAEDLDPFARLNADPAVTELLPQPLSRDESAPMITRMQSAIDERGWDFRAVDPGGQCIRFTGNTHPRFTAHCTPCV